MATGNIKGGKRNYARPTSPSTSTATTAADTTNVTVTYTPSTLGPAATSYVLTATSTTAATVTQTLTTSPTTVAFQSGATYDVTIAGQNYNGAGATAAAATGLVIPAVYSLQSTYNTNGTYTVAAGITKIAGFVVSGAGGGGGGSRSNTASYSGGGGGGGGGPAIVGFKDYTVTAGQTVTITVGTAGDQGNTVQANVNPANSGNAGGLSKITYGGTDIATANGGGGGGGGAAGSNNIGNGEGGTGGAGGTGSSNVAGAITVNGPAGGSGARQHNTDATSGSNQTSSSTISAGNNVTNLLPSNTSYGSGGGGGAATYVGKDKGAGAGDGGTINVRDAGAGTSFGGGGGGAGAMANPAAQNGAAGSAGRVILYIQ